MEHSSEIEKVKCQLNCEWREQGMYADEISNSCRQLAFAECAVLWIVFNASPNKLVFLGFLFLILYFIFDAIQYGVGMRSYYNLAKEHQKKYDRNQENLKSTDIEKPSCINRTIKQFFYVKLILMGVASIVFIGLLTNAFLS